MSDDADIPLAAVAVAIKTCGAYQRTRLRTMLKSWAWQAKPMRVIATDQPIVSKAVAENETVIMGDVEYSETVTDEEYIGWLGEPRFLREAASPRVAAYVPQWRERDELVRRAQAKRQDIPPAITRRVARALEVLYDAFAERAEWYLIVDDDTFVRFGPLRAYLATLNASTPMMVGTPVDSHQFLTSAAIASHGESTHCGGPSWAISRAALALLRPRLAECLRARDVRLAWYYDEVTLGRCLHSMLGLRCTPVRGIVTAHDGVAHTPLDDGDGASRMVITSADDPDLLTLHPALPADVPRLVERFDAAADAAWMRRLVDGTLHQHEEQLRPGGVFGTPELLIAIVVVLFCIRYVGLS